MSNYYKIEHLKAFLGGKLTKLLLFLCALAKNNFLANSPIGEENLFFYPKTV